MIDKQIVKRVAVIDNEQRMLYGIEHHLTQLGYTVDTFDLGQKFLEKYNQEQTYQDELAILILEMNMPNLDGETIVKKLRESAQSRRLQIIIYATEGSEFDKTHMIEVGADDYLLKDTPLSGLSARVESRFKMRELFFNSEKPDTIRGVEIDNLLKEIYFDDVNLGVTETEFMLLSLLIENRHGPVSYLEIRRKVFGSSATSGDAVRSTLKRLRNKIIDKAPRFKNCIVTFKSCGLQFILPSNM